MGKKGKAPKGRAGAKKKAQKGGNPNSSPWQNQFQSPRQAFDDEDDRKGFRGFAQNNTTPSRNCTPQSSNVKLRHQTISFVAAGSAEPFESTPKPSDSLSDEADTAAAEEGEEEDPNLQETAGDLGASALQSNTVDTDVEVSEGGIAQMNLHSSGEMSERDDTGPTSSDVDMHDLDEKKHEKTSLEQDRELFVVDTAGDATLAPPPSKARGKRAVKRTPSPPSDSSDDEVVFSGRGKPRTIEDPVQHSKVQKQVNPPPPQKTQQPRADPLSAWNQAARTLPHEYNSRPSAPIARDEAPRQDTIKEVFKKTSGSQGRLGSPRTYETTEHTVHGSNEPRSTDQAVTSNPPQQSQSPKKQDEPHVADDLLKALSSPPSGDDATSSPTPKARGWGASQSKADRDVNLEATWAPAPAGSWWKKGKKAPRPELDMSTEEKAAIDSSPPKMNRVAFSEPSSSKQPAVEGPSKPTETGEEGAKETIESLRANFKQKLREKQLAKKSKRAPDTVSLSAPASGSSGGRRKRGARKKDNRAIRAAIESDDDDDEAGEAAYDDYMANLAAQAEDGDAGQDVRSSFARTNGLGEPSMVVDGQAIADDELLEGHAEMMNGGDEDEWESESDGPIGQDVSDLSSDDRLEYDDISDSSDLEDELEYTEREMWEDEEDLRERRQQAMSDEQLARLLAKQQEFGLGDDDLVLDDGFGMDGIGDVDEARAGLANMTNLVNGSGKRKGARRSGGKKGLTFPDASALADSVDQYGDAGFDIMDFERPSLRPTKKGRKGKLPAEMEALSDDELKENLTTAWENDRSKKRLKKAEREDLRSQGMLGAMGKKGKADLDQKYAYQDGMSQAQIIDELRIFMKDDKQESRPFPPMDSLNRKRLHEMAHNLGLKSKSVGVGKKRFPVLYKTSQTLEFDERLFSETMRSNRESMSLNVKFARRAKKLANKGPGGRGGGKGGGGMAAASIGHGEIVGANAPELGSASKGAKFMEKMGWKPGMSLGREGEGRLVPVEQMMRVGRAGLG